MSSPAALETVLTYGPKTSTIPRVIRGAPTSKRAFSILIGNPSSRPARPVFVPNVPYLSVGPSALVEVVLGLRWGGRVEHRATGEIEPRGARGGGRQAFDVHVDPQHHAFPVGVHHGVPIIIDVYEEVEGRHLPVGAIAVEIAEISDVDPVYAGTVAIDFGTTNTCIVCSPADAWNPRLITLDGPTTNPLPGIRSIVAYESVHDRSAPRFVIGSRASAQLGQGDRTPVIHSFKRHVGSPREWLVGVDADRQIVKYDAREVGAHFLGDVKQRVEEELEARIPELGCTFPAAFSNARRRALEELFGDMGRAGRRRRRQEPTPHRMVVDEATAAAVFYVRKAFDRLEDIRHRVDGNAFDVLCYDLGGGTTDMSLTRFEVHGVERAGGSAAPEGMTVEGEVISTDGIPDFGGDNLTLAVFRLLKVSYAQRFVELLEERYREGREDGVVLGGRVMRPGEIVRAMKNLKGEIEAWIEHGDALEADASVGYAGYEGAPLPESTWATIDRLVPTRWLGLDEIDPAEAEYRAFLFNELWVEAENIKQSFGTPGEDGTYPLIARSRPPQPLQEAYNTGGGMSIDVHYATVSAHVRPPLEQSFAQTSAMVRECGCERVDFFVLAGNACRFPLVQDMFAEQLAPLGAIQGSIDGTPRNVFFDAADAKAAVAHGACMIAFERQVAGLSTWRIKDPKNILPYALGRPKPVVSFQDRNKVMHVWFEAGQSLPAHCEVTVAGRNPRLTIVGLRRAGAIPRLIGHFDFDRAESRGAVDGLPDDVRDAIRDCRITDLASDEGDDHYKLDIVVTADRRIWAQRAGAWYALFPAPFELAPAHNPFSGAH